MQGMVLKAIKHKVELIPTSMLNCQSLCSSSSHCIVCVCVCLSLSSTPGPNQRHALWEHQPPHLVPPAEPAAHRGGRERAPPAAGGEEEVMSCKTLTSCSFSLSSKSSYATQALGYLSRQDPSVNQRTLLFLLPSRTLKIIWLTFYLFHPTWINSLALFNYKLLSMWLLE